MDFETLKISSEDGVQPPALIEARSILRWQGWIG